MEKLGEYIYMGMGKIDGRTVCMSVAYKIEYCVKKALQFENAANGDILFKKVNKVRVGETEACESFKRCQLTEYVSKFIQP